MPRETIKIKNVQIVFGCTQLCNFPLKFVSRIIWGKRIENNSISLSVIGWIFFGFNTFLLIINWNLVNQRISTQEIILNEIIFILSLFSRFRMAAPFIIYFRIVCNPHTHKHTHGRVFR